jgi:uncharacterized protein YdeI (YjbR/CyaY-like superfamily)
MKTSKTFRATSREAWHAWLARHHASEKEVWLVFPKAATGRKSISYEDAVEEALCHGWIDSLIKRIDDKTYARKFTPRTNNLNWSELNKRRIAKLIQEGRMTDVGMAKVSYANPERSPAKSKRTPKRKTLAPPAFMKQALRATGKAWANFNRLAPSHQRAYVGWITFARREETRRKRLSEAIQMLTENKKLGLR